MKSIKTLVLAAAFLVCSYLTTASAAVDMFLKLDGVKGESRDDTHKGEIEILSFSWGLSQTGSHAAGGGGGAGKVNVHDISITKFFDAASPALFLNCVTGKRIPTATLYVRNRLPTDQAAPPQRPAGEFLEITLTDVLISSLNENGDGSGPQGELAEKITLNFTKVSIKYTPVGADGGPGIPIIVTYDLKLNKKV